MLLASLGVVAALAFVLGLGAVALWLVKRFASGGLAKKSRVQVEVVQRMSLGPKTGLAVVRVGERVMAISIGEGGVRPLFDLEESDRQRIIATSPMPVSLAPSTEAEAALNRMTSKLVKSGKNILDTYGPPAMASSSALGMASSFAPASAFPGSTATASTPQRGEHEFRAMLGMSLYNTSRIAVAVVGAVLAASLSVIPGSSLLAQGSPPPVIPIAVPPVSPPVIQPGVSPLITSAPTAPPTVAPQVVVPQPPAPPAAPVLTLPASTNGVRVATPAPGATVNAVGTSTAGQPASQRATSTATQAAAVRGANRTLARPPMSDMQFDSATAAIKSSRGRAAAATPAAVGAVGGSDDAVMRMMPQIDLQVGDSKDGGLRLNGTVGIVVMMGLMTLLPTLVLMMTGFTRILIVLHFLKQAMGTQGAPPAQLLAGLALLLTGFVMAPTLSRVNSEAVTPWLDGEMTQVEMLKNGVKPLREFMVRQTRSSDIKTFVEMSRMPQPDGIDDVPLHVLMTAFVASELRTAFEIGFRIYLPFIIIDTVVASVLMSMGMFMLPPAMISLPFKLLLFVLVDGWALTIQSLVQSFK